MRHFYTILFVFLLSSCQVVYNTVPKIDNNDTKNYSVLSHEVSNDYRYINENLLFVYDEKYNDNELNYKIYSKEGKVLFSDIDKPIPIKYGRNYIDLVFLKRTYSSWSLLNPLLLEVTNEKNQKQYLKFIYSL